MNPEHLLKHAEVALSVAKKDLVEKGKVLPTLVMVQGNNQPYIIAPVPDRKIIPAILRKENPEAFTWAYEVWIRDSPTAEKRDAIEVVGGSGISRILMRQEYRRQNGTVTFDRALTLSEDELTRHAFGQAMADPLTGEIMGMWAVAPSGGRVFCAPMYGLRIWIPEGWRMAREIGAEDGKPRPTFYRSENGHGGLRISTFRRDPSSIVDPIAEASQDAARRRNEPGVENLKVEQKSTSDAVVGWTKVVGVPGHDPMSAHAWRIYDLFGGVLLSFTHVTTFTEEDVASEVSSVEEIVRRLSRL